MTDANHETVDGATATLATFIHDRFVPKEAQAAARRALATVVPLSVGAIREEAPLRALRLAEHLGGDGSASVLGTSRRTSPMLAALVNGTAANSDDFDDTDLLTFVQPSASVVSAALAAVEAADATVDVLLDAIAVGNEVAIRFARAFGSAHVGRGWDISSTSNHLGTAAAAAVALGLNEQQVRGVLGLSATQVAGLGAALGSMTKPFHFGKAASDGVEAALLTSAGLTSPEHGIEGRRGLLAVVAPGAEDGAVLTDELGDRWDFLEVMPKPYPCGSLAHPVIDAAIDIGRETQDTGQITRLWAHVYSKSLDFMDRPNPDTSLEAKLSLQYCVAAGFRHGRLGLGEFAPTSIRDSRTVRLMRTVELVGDRTYPGAAALVAVCADGSERSTEVTVARGTIGRPLTDDEVASKGAESAARVLGSEAAERLVNALLTCQRSLPVRTLTGLARRAKPGCTEPLC